MQSELYSNPTARQRVTIHKNSTFSFRSGSYGYGIDNPYAYGMDIESWKSDKMTNVRYKVKKIDIECKKSFPYKHPLNLFKKISFFPLGFLKIFDFSP